MAVQARAFWVREPGVGEIRPATVPTPGPSEVLVRTLRTGISRGTETLVFRGGVPADQRAVMRAPHQEGDLPGPVKYGYLNVGVVEVGPPNLLGRTVFCLYPHQSVFVVPADAVVVVPDDVPPDRAVLAGTVETAVNALWDAAPLVGDRVAVVGAGMVGLCVARLLTGIPGADVTVVDVDRTRAPRGRGDGSRVRAARRRPPQLRPGRARERDIGGAAAGPRRPRAGGHGARPQLVRRLRGHPAARGVVPLEPTLGARQPGRHGVTGAARAAHRRRTGWPWRCSCCETRPSTCCSPAARRSTSCPT